MPTGSEQTGGERPASEGHNRPPRLSAAEIRARKWRARDWHLKEAFRHGVEIVAHRAEVERIDAELKAMEGAE